MKKFIFNTLCFLSLITISKLAFSSTFCNGSKQFPCIVQDTQDNTPLTHWRDAHMIAAAYKGNITGLNNLWMSGSAAPSQKAWLAIKNKIKHITHHKVKKIIIIDLRQESHGYLNHNAINLTTKYNWINYGKTRAEILNAEKNWLDSLRQKQSLTNVLVSHHFKINHFSSGITIPVKTVASEEETVTRAGFDYVRFTVPDHMKPSDEDVDRFVTLIQQLPKNTWLHFHCRGGKGRTTTFLVMYDILYNSKNVSFDEIIKRQSAVNPYYNLYNNHRVESSPLLPFYEERLQFLKKFYQFGKARLNGYNGNWSKWIKDISL